MTDQLQKFCSGVMINNGKGDGRQLLLTANHCVFTDLSNSIAGFNYERLGCGTGIIRQPQTAHGMKLIARWPDSDFALFEVQERIPVSYNVFLSGWDARKRAASNVAGIHHPSGDVKKISLFTGTLQAGSWSEGPGRSLHWVIPAWSRGVTEPGSSGSPLFSSSGLVIGQLHGGASACNNPGGADLYGALAFSFDGNGREDSSLKPHLDPLVRGITLLPGRDLYPTPRPTTAPTVTITATRTVAFTTTVCPSCLPRDMVERMLNSTNARLEYLERKVDHE
jgi:hypothetical protein